jgi:hypothetical protein
MDRRAVMWTLALVLLLLLPGSAALATPTPPYIIVNHTTKECGQSILGDDCSWCDPPPGWEVVGPAAGNQCPEGYTVVERIDMQCRRYKNQFCCSGFAHRGDCEDMVVHDADRLCAFVEDIQGCILPEGWTARPPDVELSGWMCPHDYRWADPVACLDAAAGDEPTAAVTPATTEAEPPTAEAEPVTAESEPVITEAELATARAVPPDAPVDTSGSTEVILLGCLGAVLVAVIAVGVALVVTLARRRRR